MSEHDLEAFLSRFPKTRPSLPEAHRKIYVKEYADNRDGNNSASGMAQRLEGWMHRKVASSAPGRLLELGAGTLNHLKYEHPDTEYDIVEPFAALYQNSDRLTRISKVYGNLSEVPEDAQYDRVISVAVLEHLENLPTEVARAGRLLGPDGVFQAGIPSEGEFLWWLAWRSVTGTAYYLRNGLDYGQLMAHEHVNTAKEIVKVCEIVFNDVHVQSFPLGIKHLSFYKYIECRQPKHDVLRRILDC